MLHAPLGKVSFGPEKILGNLKALVETGEPPEAFRGQGHLYEEHGCLHHDGPGFKVDMTLIKKFIEANPL